MNSEEFTPQQKHLIRIKKKAQEEMVGFVLIMLVVAIAFLVFLGIYLRKAPTQERTENIEISNFIEAIFEVSTSCTLSGANPATIDELIIECDSNGANNCGSGINVCDELKSELKNITESSWLFNESSVEKGYILTVKRLTDAGEQGILSVSKGSLTSTVRSAEKPLPGGIIIILEIHT